MSSISRDNLVLQFRTTNNIGLAMVGAVFVYAGLVWGISQGHIAVKIRPVLGPDTTNIIKYGLLCLAFAHYFIIRFFQKASQKEANRLASGAILTLALSEAVGIYGLVVFFLTGQAKDFFNFMAFSLFYFYLFYPRLEDWEKILAREKKAASSSK